ncbi:MAG TPA: flagellar motor protein MotB [Acidobacteriaceae bacterium]|jgi:chemotaxis protein MotB|nr:flagellar motor protein MotB [Acidobacteriaceae bacterium]
MPAAKPIIVIKKKSGHGGHHGGAWKVAYADFVTAMMSLFIVLWLMNTSEKVRQAVAGYFNDPKGTAKETGTDQSGTSDNLALTEKNIPELKKKIEEAIHKMNDLKTLQNQIQITITPEGLRIELLETKDGTFFDTGSAKVNRNGEELLKMIAGQLGDLPNCVSIEGHTDAAPYASKDGYGNWDLSTDRANAARRVMQNSGLRANQVSQVRGFADQKLRVPSNPLDPSNRRISLIVQYLTVDAPPVPLDGKSPGAPGGAGAKPGGSPGSDVPAAGAGAGKPGAATPGSAGDARTASDAKPASNGPPGAPQASAPANSTKPGPSSKPSAAKPAGGVVARLWLKIHSK